ncbi:MAG: hypothetical protein Q8K86_05785 [Candidatus Nanopelagicaceae bacterium]|nr:hypothetical protein [Candidatus Nanopelagicaceae bacterium]
MVRTSFLLTAIKHDPERLICLLQQRFVQRPFSLCQTAADGVRKGDGFRIQFNDLGQALLKPRQSGLGVVELFHSRHFSIRRRAGEVLREHRDDGPTIFLIDQYVAYSPLFLRTMERFIDVGGGPLFEDAGGQAFSPITHAVALMGDVLFLGVE